MHGNAEDGEFFSRNNLQRQPRLLGYIQWSPIYCVFEGQTQYAFKFKIISE